MRTRYQAHHPKRRGSAIVVMILMMVIMTGVSYALLQTALAGHKEQRQEREAMSARYVSQAGLADGLYDLQRGQTGVLGTPLAPLPWGKSRFYVTRTDLSADVISLQSTGLDVRSAARMELVVRRVPTTMWRFGAFGKESFHMDSNARADSYDSSLGTYASQAINGTGSDRHGRTNGDVGSNGNVGLDQNGKVWGSALPGPGHTTTVLGNAMVTGSTTPLTTPMELPDLVLPTYPSFGSLTVSANTTIPSGNRTYSNMTVNNNKTLTINGPANVVMTNLHLRSGSALRLNTAGGPVTLWVIDDFIMDSNAQLAPLNLLPQDVQINLLSDNVINPEVTIQLDTVDLASNTKLYGMVYAPNAAVTIRSNFELFGSLVARSVDLNSNATFHFDEALIPATSSGPPVFETVCWRELPYVAP
jgi:hypothetical protein